MADNYDWVMLEPQIPRPCPLTNDGVTLNREAVGWATQPIIDTDRLGAGRGRNKRWEYWNISTPNFIVGLTVSHIDYAAVPEIWVYERSSSKTWGSAGAVIPARGTIMAKTLEQGSSSAETKNLKITIEETSSENIKGTLLKANFDDIYIEAFAELPNGHERLAVVVPWSDKRFQYTVKDVARPARAVITIGGERHEDQEDTWAVLDHGRGRWPYDISWNWAAGSGISNGKRIGIQLGAKWTAGTGVSENAFFVDGKMFKIHGETEWQYDIENWQEPWRVHGGGFDAIFKPFYNKQSSMNFIVLKGRTDQCFGVWEGTFESAKGEIYAFEGIQGFAEEVHNRW